MLAPVFRFFNRPAPIRSERRTARQEIDRRTGCFLALDESLASSGWAQVLGHTLNRHGMAVLHNQAIDVDTRLFVRLRPSHSEVYRCPGRVVGCRNTRPGVYDIGIEFDQPIDVECLFD